MVTRLGLEASRPLQLSSGASLIPSLEMSLRYDGGDPDQGLSIPELWIRGLQGRASCLG